MSPKGHSGRILNGLSSKFMACIVYPACGAVSNIWTLFGAWCRPVPPQGDKGAPTFDKPSRMPGVSRIKSSQIAQSRTFIQSASADKSKRSGGHTAVPECSACPTCKAVKIGKQNHVVLGSCKQLHTAIGLPICQIQFNGDSLNSTAKQ